MEFEKNISLKEHNTFGVNVKCKLYCKVKSEKEVVSVINSEEYKNNSHLILSGGSNVLFLKDYGGLIIQNEILIEHGQKILVISYFPRKQKHPPNFLKSHQQ